MNGIGPAVKLSDPGERPKMALRHKNALFADPDYQRAKDSARSRRLIEDIAVHFDWKKFGVLPVTMLGAIIDGQHRHAAAMLRPDVDFVPCLVFDITPSEAAAVFVSVNRDRVNIAPQAVYKAELKAGLPEAVRAKEAADEAGVQIIVNAVPLRELKPNQTQAVSTIRSQVRHNRGACVRALKACIAARVTLSAAAIQFAFRHAVTFDDDDLTLRMLRQNFLKHGAAAPDPAYIPSGFVAKIEESIAAPVQSGEIVGGVVVRRFEAGGSEAIIENTLRDAGFAARVAYKGHPPKKVMMLNGQVVPWDRALVQANELREKKGLPRI